jgi:hypothetical protein
MGELDFWNLSGASDEHLLQDLKDLVASGGHVNASMVAHLAEVEERRLHLKAATSSLFDYCLRRLGFSESEAFHRITAARLGRRFPVIFELLRKRSIHLSALRVLRDHLTLANHRELLTAASGKSKKEVEMLVAAFAPRPDVATLLRRLPERRERRMPAQSEPSPTDTPRFGDDRESKQGAAGTRQLAVDQESKPSTAGARQLAVDQESKPSTAGTRHLADERESKPNTAETPRFADDRECEPSRACALPPLGNLPWARRHRLVEQGERGQLRPSLRPAMCCAYRWGASSRTSCCALGI